MEIEESQSCKHGNKYTTKVKTGLLDMIFLRMEKTSEIICPDCKKESSTVKQ